jgi:EAL and modified HD-GYP domain-containing signal transduction protein
METNLLMARRSIYDTKVNSVAYELLFQKQDATHEEQGIVPSELTMEYINYLFVDESMQKVVGSKKVWIPFSFSLLNEDLSILPRDRLVIILNPKNITMNESLLNTVIRLKTEGFEIALQDFTDVDNIKKLLPYIAIAGIDVEVVKDEWLQSLSTLLLSNGVKVIGNNIQSHESFNACIATKFSFFEGYFLNLPNLVDSQKVSTSHLTTMRLLTALDDDAITLNRVEELLSQDARLSYRLLRAVNSAAFGFRRKIESLREAIIYLGLKQIKSWANIIILSGLDDKPNDLLLTSMARAKMCEIIAQYIGADDPKPFFTVGLFSTLDAMLDKSMENIVDELSLSDRLRGALLHREGDIGAVLANVIGYSRAEWEELRDSGIEMEVWRQAYLESLQWATSSLNEIQLVK